MALVPEDTLRYYLGDYENCPDIEKENSKLSSLWIDKITDANNWTKLIELCFDESQLKTYYEGLDSEEIEKSFSFAVSCILCFVQRNFTGPDLPKSVAKFLSSDIFKGIDFPKMLSVNNEEINLNTELPQLLVAAKVIFQTCQFNDALNLWWMWRVTMIHQQIFDELSPTLLSVGDRLRKELLKLTLNENIKAKLEIELAQLYILYRNVPKAAAHTGSASGILGVKYELSGKLGKRTKYQEKEIAQLSLEVTLQERDAIKRPPVNDFSLPQNLKLDDDVRLETVSHSENTDIKPTFSDTEQKLLLLIIQEMMCSKPRDELFYEEVEPFINLILEQKNTWTIRVATLLLRCKLEGNHNRTIERSLQQCEEILKNIRKDDPHPLNRVGGVFATGLQPFWKTLGQYADLLLNLGLTKRSLEMYLKLQLWEEVIVCYTILKMRHKASEIIKQELDKKPTVKLWCLLGDATDDVTCYERAWELSKRRSHRAQRHWGQYFFSRKQYQECIPHFEKSVSINPLQAIVWLRLGFAALEMENWQVAATAYRRYTTLEPDGFEAWNNLAQAYIKLGNKRSAHQARPRYPSRHNDYHGQYRGRPHYWKPWWTTAADYPPSTARWMTMGPGLDPSYSYSSKLAKIEHLVAEVRQGWRQKKMRELEKQKNKESEDEKTDEEESDDTTEEEEEESEGQSEEEQEDQRDDEEAEENNQQNADEDDDSDVIPANSESDYIDKGTDDDTRRKREIPPVINEPEEATEKDYKSLLGRLENSVQRELREIRKTRAAQEITTMAPIIDPTTMPPTTQENYASELNEAIKSPEEQLTTTATTAGLEDEKNTEVPSDEEEYLKQINEELKNVDKSKESTTENNEGATIDPDDIESFREMLRKHNLNPEAFRPGHTYPIPEEPNQAVTNTGNIESSTKPEDIKTVHEKVLSDINDGMWKQEEIKTAESTYATTQAATTIVA